MSVHKVIASVLQPAARATVGPPPTRSATAQPSGSRRVKTAEIVNLLEHELKRIEPLVE